LLYPSYGDTYPTYVGGIGMTYEQAGGGRAGLGIIKADGEELTLVDRLTHHTTSGLSTVEIASKNTASLNSEFKKYFSDRKLKYKSYVLRGNQSKTNKLIGLLNKHEIAYGYANGKSVSGFDYDANSKGSMKTSTNDLVVSTNQPKGKLIKALFEPVAKLSDSITYDITAWSLPYAYGFKTIASQKLVASTKRPLKSTHSKVTPNAFAYTFSWNHISDSKVLAALLQHNIRVRFTRREINNSGQHLPTGSIIVLRGDNKHIVNFDQKVASIANQNNKKTTTLTTGFSDNGPDLGSSYVREIKNQKIAVLAGKYTSSLSFGEVQYFFEQEIKYPYTAINTDNFSVSLLKKYHTLVLPNGYYSGLLKEKQLKDLASWIRSGGKVIAIGNANSLFADKKGFGLTSKEKDSDTIAANKSDKELHLVAYDQLKREGIQNSISGAIFKTKIDNSHPLAFGYDDSYFTLKLSSNSYAYLKDGYNVVRLEDNTAISGFAGHKTFENLTKSLIFGEEQIGSGSIIYMIDNPLFRGFWENGKLFFANALFMTNPSMKKL